MGRAQCVTEPGLAYHVLNQRVMRVPLSQKDDHYLALGCFVNTIAGQRSLQGRESADSPAKAKCAMSV